MRVILTSYVYKHGVAGEIVSVADGFARNFLIPKKMAIPATKANMQNLAALREQATINRAELNDQVNTAARKINGTEIVFGMKAGSNNKLYGSITSQMIKDALLAKTGIDINRRRISEKAIRELGRYEVPVRMGDVSPVLNVIIVREDEVQDYYAKQAAALAAAEAPVVDPVVTEAPAEAS